LTRREVGRNSGHDGAEAGSNDFSGKKFE